MREAALQKMHVVEVDGDKEAVGQQPCGGVCKADGGVADPAHDGKADKAAGVTPK